ncbi:MAG: ABC transporter permease [Caldilineaceae bacterium SB0662_bin_9]|uniref:ABC transporter permease n=1 Tax=Caldilineaceae bacterium SB0662_bin_9 TaxID=2605258 RepID=A0A6B1DSQ0_9CHLR|nr:ABC transporter permease [Caldilineaceae bacterium SB0662_bin_9]
MTARAMESDRQEAINVATQWQLMWWRFRKHRLAMTSLVIVILIYLVALLAEFLAPFTPDEFQADYTYAPPQRLHLFLETENGLRFQPWVHGYKVEIEEEALRRVFVPDEEVIHEIGFFVSGVPITLFGFLETDRHLVGPKDPEAPMFLFGADKLGRDMLTRMIYGTRISMSIGLVGVALSLILGILLGGLSGFLGGQVDNIIQRVIEFIRSVPTIPLWMGLAAALPTDWPPLRIYFGITVILSFIGWTELARVIRGRFLALRTEDFVIAAHLDGVGQMRIILHHMVPSFLSHIIAALTLAIPNMILAETSLSFLGLGLRPPIVSWGVLLQEAQNIRTVATAPWLFSTGGAVFIAILALNFVGDGLRDAADPYAR